MALLKPSLPRGMVTMLTRTTTRSITFESVRKGLPDPMQDLKRAMDAGSHPHKVDIGAGVYRNEKGQYHEFEVIREAKQRLEALRLGHDYNPTTGIPAFTKHAAELLLSKDRPALREHRVASVQTVGGTGANRIGAAFLRRCFFSSGDDAVAYLGEPAWGNYKPLFENAGFRVETFQYCKKGATTPDHKAIMASIESAPRRSVFILQASCHNPTGLDYTRSQWQDVAIAMRERQHFAFFDAAYLGFGSGKTDAPDDDAWALRHFIDIGVDTLVCQSFSKICGMYSERVGALHVVCPTSQIKDNVFDQLRAQIRWEVSSSPAYGAQLVDIVLADKALSREWRKELNNAAARIENNRGVLHELLTKQGTPGKWDHVLHEKGLFSYLQLNKTQIDALKKSHHVYLPPNGRINVAGLSGENIERVAAAIDVVVRL